MKRAILLLCCLPLCSTVWSQSIKFTLEEAINYALQKNFGQQSLVIDRKIQQNVLDQSKLEQLPDLNASLSGGVTHAQSNGTSWNNDYGVTTTMPIYQGGKIMNTIKMNKLSLQQVDSKIIQTQNTLAINVIQAFLEIIMSEELYGYLQAVEKTSTEQMIQGEVKFKNGQILESDYLLLKAQAATDRFNVIDTKTSRDNAILKLKGLLSMNTADTLNISAPQLDSISLHNTLPALQEVVERTFEWLPDLKIAQQNILLSTLDIKQAKTAYMPQLSLKGSVGSGYTTGATGYGSQLSNRFNQQAGLTLSIPLWNRGKTKAQVTQATYRLRQSELDQADTQLQLKQNLEQQYNNVSTGFQQYLSSSERADAYRASATAYQKQFELGLITAVEMLQQETNYLNALNTFIQNKYNYLLNRKIIDVYMGVPIVL